MKRIDIKRLNEKAGRKRIEGTDDDYSFNMYDPDGAVLFLNLTHDLGKIERISENAQVKKKKKIFFRKKNLRNLKLFYKIQQNRKYSTILKEIWRAKT